MSLSNCILSWSFSGTGCSNYETRYIDGPTGVSNIAISGNSGSNAVNVDGLYSLKGEDNSGGTVCSDKQWNVNVSGCEGCNGSASYSFSNLRSFCQNGSYFFAVRVDHDCTDLCCGTLMFDLDIEIISNGVTIVNSPFSRERGCNQDLEILGAISIGANDPCDFQTMRFSGFATSDCITDTFDEITVDLSGSCGCTNALKINEIKTQPIPKIIKGQIEYDHTFIAPESKTYTFELSSYYRKDQFIINDYDTGCIRTQSGIDNNEPLIYGMDLQAGEEISIEVNECTALNNSWKIIIK